MTIGLTRAVLDIAVGPLAGPATIADRQRRRILDVVAYSRVQSPYYRRLYAGADIDPASPLSQLPVTRKSELMASFDEWVTDPDVTDKRTRAFIDDHGLVGTKFLDRYRIGTTSGSSGVRGIFLFDEGSSRITSAMTARAFLRWLSPGDLGPLAGARLRTAMLLATGGHFGSSTVVPSKRGPTKVFSVFSPIAELVAGLNAFQPAMLVGYAGVIQMLAREQLDGRLDIAPVLTVLGAEGLSEPAYARVKRAFGKVGNGYGACEFMCAASSCAADWLHVNSDWVVLEPVDADHQPAAMGTVSHSVLLTNLANRVQPIIRYELGDSIETLAGACDCGSTFPAIRVQGRSSEVMRFLGNGGRLVPIAPIALSGIVTRTPGLDQAQVVQTSTSSLRLRITTHSGVDPAGTMQTLQRSLATFFVSHEVAPVECHWAQEPPQISGGGKYKLVIPLESQVA